MPLAYAQWSIRFKKHGKVPQFASEKHQNDGSFSSKTSTIGCSSAGKMGSLQLNYEVLTVRPPS